MTLTHLDGSGSLQEPGFTNVNDEPQRMKIGQGGVDDAEYGHAIQDSGLA